jgi:outer membrane murein-binding lipoprotein Lpp
LVINNKINNFLLIFKNASIIGSVFFYLKGCGYRMSIEITILISGISVAFAIYFGIKNSKRNEKEDIKSDASQLTTVIVKLENISTGITEIKTELCNVKNDVKEDRERIIRVEESAKQAHKRIDTCEKYCKRFGDTNE